VKDITSDYAGRPPLLVGVLKGAFVFMSDLARSIRLPVEFDFMAVASYGSATKTSGIVRIVKDLDLSLDFYHGVGARMPVTSLVRELYAEAATHSGQLDVSAIVRRYEMLSPGPKDQV